MLNLHDDENDLISSLLSNAWQHRVAQELDQCRTLVAEIRIAMGMPLGRLEVSVLANKLDRNFRSVDVVCLVASLARADRQFAYSKDLLFALDSLASDAGYPRTFRLSQELGHTFFLRGDFASAANQYFAAKSLSKNPREAYQSAMNALLCLENLGLPLQDTKHAAASALAEFEDSAKIEEAGPLQLFYAREHFRAGEIKQSLEILSQPDAPMLAEYDRNYIKSLPYHIYFDPSCQRGDERWSEKTRGLFLRDYRYRTLVGLTHPDDGQSVKPQEVAERIYLWLWRWLVTEGEFPVHKLLVQLNQILNAEPAFLTENDRHLLVVSLTWLDLLDPLASKYIRRLRADLELSAPAGGSLLALEYLGVCLLILKRDGKECEARDVEEQLISHPLWESAEINFSVLFSQNGLHPARNFSGELLVRLRNALKPLPAESALDKRTNVQVKLASFEISSSELDSPIVSKPLALGLAAIKGQSNLTMQSLLFYSFQIQNYDPTAHDSKIYNLLARVKKILPKVLRVRVKEGHIIKTGSWKLVQIEKPSPLAASLGEDPLWLALLTRTTGGAHRPDTDQNLSRVATGNEIPPMATSTDSATCKVGERLTRDDIQIRFQFKRSTANRIIAGWEKAGKIRRLGTGKSTAYVVKKTFNANAKPRRSQNHINILDEL